MTNQPKRLTLVGPASLTGVAALMAQAEALARDDAAGFAEEVKLLWQHANAIAQGGPAYAVGVREECRYLALALEPHVLRLRALVDR